MPDLKLTEGSLAGHPLVALEGELTHANAPELRRVLVHHFRRRCPVLAVDMTGVSFMDTSGLATLIEAHNQVTRTGGRVLVFGLQPQIARVFEVTRVSTLFAIHPDRGQAERALTAGSS